MRIFEDMIGSRLISLNNNELKILTPDGKVKIYEFEEDYGDCCGYNDFSTLVIDPDNLNKNPVITNIEEAESDKFNNGDDGESVKITLFGEYKPLATIDSISGSGSGYRYGACVTLVCKETGEEETITYW